MVSNVPGRKIRHCVYTYNMYIFAGRRKRFPLEGGYNTLNNGWDIFHSFYHSLSFVETRRDQISHFVPWYVELNKLFECLFRQDIYMYIELKVILLLDNRIIQSENDIWFGFESTWARYSNRVSLSTMIPPLSPFSSRYIVRILVYRACGSGSGKEQLGSNRDSIFIINLTR